MAVPAAEAHAQRLDTPATVAGTLPRSNAGDDEVICAPEATIQWLLELAPPRRHRCWSESANHPMPLGALAGAVPGAYL